MTTNEAARILVISDYDATRQITVNLLDTLGFTHIEQATSVAEALEKLRGCDLAIIDWSMDEGAGFLKAARANADIRDIPFIAVASDSGPDAIEAAKRAGVTAYLVKPFNAESLKAKIESALTILA